MPTNELSLSLAVLIDADNTSARYAHAIFEEIVKLGEANVRRIYGDFSGTRLAGWNREIQSLAILQHQQRNNTTGKNAADIALVIDAMDLMHKGKLDGFCLISSDSDFTRLAQRLREDGLVVYGFGERKTPEAFRNACNRFIYVDNLSETAAGEETGATAAVPSGGGKEGIPFEEEFVYGCIFELIQETQRLAADIDSRHDKLQSVIRSSGVDTRETADGAEKIVRVTISEGETGGRLFFEYTRDIKNILLLLSCQTRNLYAIFPRLNSELVSLLDYEGKVVGKVRVKEFFD